MNQPMWTIENNPQITLRQRYKGQALQGLLSELSHPQSSGWMDKESEKLAQVIAVRTGLIADAMIAEDETYEEQNAEKTS